MPEYLSPGVYIEEVDKGAKAIEGVSTTTSGMVGVSERGPIGVPTLVIGASDYRRQFGGYLDRREYKGMTSDVWYLPHAVEGFFTNGGQRSYIVRVLPDTATSAEATLFDRGASTGPATTLALAANPKDGTFLVSNGAGIVAGDWLKLYDGTATEYVQVAAVKTPVLMRGSAGSTHPLGKAVTGFSEGAANPLVAQQAKGDTTLVLSNDVAAFQAAGVIALAVGNPNDPNREYQVINSIDANPINKIHLKAPLAFDHNTAIPVTPLTSLTPATTLSTALAAGERLLALDGSIPP
jgi:phage tail sheath protein FI